MKRVQGGEIEINGDPWKNKQIETIKTTPSPAFTCTIATRAPVNRTGSMAETTGAISWPLGVSEGKIRRERIGEWGRGI